MTAPLALADDLAMALDPTLLADRAAHKLGFTTLDPWQREMLLSASKRIILNCARQIGKSSVLSLKIMHRAIYVPDSPNLVVTPSLRQSRLLFKKCLQVYLALGKPLKATVQNRLSLELENGSEVVALPGAEETVRGFSAVGLLVLDEDSRIPDDLYLALRPMLAMSNGTLILASTPFGKRGHFHQEWTAADPAHWHKIQALAEQYAYRYPPGFLEEERKLGDRYFRQEYGGEFVETVDSVFPYDLIARAVDADVTPLLEDVTFDEGVLLDDLAAIGDDQLVAA